VFALESEQTDVSLRILRMMPLPEQLITIALCALCPALLVAQRTTLDRDVPQALQDNRVPSVSIAKLSKGKVVLVCAYGRQDSQKAAEPSTLYNIASLTKPITAQVAMLLISQGRFALDESMAPTWVDPDVAEDKRNKLLTPRIALTHQTGFANWRSMTNDKLSFQFTPGTDYGYSGEGFEYLSRFMERRTGLSLDANAKRLVFDPLKMRATSFTRQPWFEGRVAVPADEAGKWLTPRFADRPISADLVYTTAHDYALLLQAIFAKRGLNAQVAAERDKIQVDLRGKMCPGLPSPTLCPDTLGSGLSWQIVRFIQTTILMHTGHDPGVYTFAYLSPTTGDGVVILTNGENGKRIVPIILRDLNAPADFVHVLFETRMK
jgi:CubicO group peptidase (beta-lactamase class C family)